jgi:hypothetical protein
MRDLAIRFFFIDLSFHETYRITDLQNLYGRKILLFLFLTRRKLFIFI